MMDLNNQTWRYPKDVLQSSGTILRCTFSLKVPEISWAGTPNVGGGQISLGEMLQS